VLGFIGLTFIADEFEEINSIKILYYYGVVALIKSSRAFVSAN
jgi:hypothetical protein